MISRIVRAFRLDASLFREVAADPKFMGEAVLIALVVSFLAAVGGAIGHAHPLPAFLAEWANGLLLGWLLWAIVALLVGSLLGGKSGFGQMTRALAYAGVPRLLALFGFIPCVGWAFRLAAWVLALIAGTIAIREAMQFDTGRAIVTAVIGWIIYVIVAIVIGGIGVLAGLLGGLARSRR